MKIHNTDCMYYKCIINAALQELEDAIRSANFNGSHVMHGGGGLGAYPLDPERDAQEVNCTNGGRTTDLSQ